ncbi:hypothetical protein ACO0RG_002918 [Hanseniaspora osmophila]|uniref:Translation machinery-associated protein 16 n=1 Tax=Hanseniaspora osmophila TaxID=56408 RepID=A0A1E5R850_9ASCO|nr:Translation machinery-associated protein 16 [Hanseniaspora osmophila]
MPSGKSLVKVQKSIGDRKHKVHPKGRKFAQLAKATLRDSRVAAKKKAHSDQRSNELQRYSFIQEIINSDSFKDKDVFTPEELIVFVEQFIARDDEELDELKAKRRADRPPANKQMLLEQKRKFEDNEFVAGFLAPNITDVTSVKALRGWNGTFGGLNACQKIRITKHGDISNEKASTKDVVMN